MSLLEAVTEARELRTAAGREFARAVVRASEGGLSLRKIAAATETETQKPMTFSAIRFILIKERGTP